MRITYLAPGTGSYYCGTCLRDQALVGGLCARGHEVDVVPMYLPSYPEREETADAAPIRMGAVNLYLQQKAPTLCSILRPVSGLLDSPKLLRWISRRAGATDPAFLGEMTLSMLEGAEGPLSKMVRELVASIATGPRPDAIFLSNALLVGMAGPLSEHTGARIVCSLQGEAPFLDALPEPHRQNAWGALRERSVHVDRFIAVSRFYAGWMAERMALPAEAVSVVWNGLETAALEIEPASPERPTIGYLARMCEDKGISLLVEAFVHLRERGLAGEPRLRIAGVQLAEDRPLVERLQARLRAAGLEGDVEWLPNLEVSAKRGFLRSLSVFSVPATKDEAFGLYVLEANAAAVPVALPEHAAFPEILERTGGGVLCEPDDPAALAGGLAGLLNDPEEARRLGARGREAVREHFTAGRMAAEVEGLLREIVEGSSEARARG